MAAEYGAGVSASTVVSPAGLIGPLVMVLDTAGVTKPLTLATGNRLSVQEGDLLAAQLETNRLLRKLIRGLETYLGNQFVEVE